MVGGLSFYPANIYTRTHCDKVIAISTPPYYVIGGENNNTQFMQNFRDVIIEKMIS